MQEYSIEKEMHEGVYKKVEAFAATKPDLTGERKRLVEKTVHPFVQVHVT